MRFTGGGGLGGGETTFLNIGTKQPVRAASLINGTLATAYENGDTIDGITLVTGDRILLKDQTDGSENGIYTVNASGAPTRATDFDTDAEVTGGQRVWVQEGTIQRNMPYVLTNTGTIIIDTTDLVFIPDVSNDIKSLTPFLRTPVITVLEDMGSGTSIAKIDGTATVTADTVDFRMNNGATPQSIKVVTADDGLASNIGSTTITSTDLSAKYIHVLMKCDDFDNLNRLQLEVGSSSSAHRNYRIQAQFEKALKGEWIWIDVDIDSQFSTTGSPNMAAITYLNIEVTDENSGAVTVHWQAFTHSPQASQGNIIIMIDDGGEETYDNAFPALQQFGISATLSIIPSLLGSGGAMTFAELKEMQSAGHEVVLHQHVTPAPSDLSTLGMENIIENERKILRQNGIDVSDIFVAPGGNLSDIVIPAYRAKASITRSIKSSQLVQPPMYWDVINGGRQIGSGTSVATATGFLDGGDASNMCVIIYFHDIVTSGATGIQYNLADFKAILQHIQDNGYTVFTFTQWIAWLNRQA